MDKKIRAISVAYTGSFFARILILIIKFLADFIWKSYHNKTHVEISF